MPPESKSSPSRWLTEHRIRLATALFGALLAVVAGWLGLTRIGGALRMMSYDLPFLFNPALTTESVRVVYLDEFSGESIDRRVQAGLLDRLGEAGARAVIYDLIFDQPSEDPQVDRDFAAAILRFRGVDADWNPIEGQPRRFVVMACGRKEIRQLGAIGEQLIPPTDELLAAADDFGLVAMMHDKDFTVRELATGTRDEPSMTWKTASMLGTALEEGERLAPRWLRFRGRPIGDSPVPLVPAIGANEVLRDSNPELFRDKIVVVGAKPGIVGQAAGQDLFATPFHRFDLRGDLPLSSGVVLQATALSNLLQRDWITRTKPRTETWLVVIAGIIAGLGCSRLRPLAGVLGAVLVIVLLAVAGTWFLQAQGIWFPWSVMAFLQVPVAVVWGAASHFYIERFFRAKLGEEQRQLREAFTKYLSPEMLDLLTAKGFQVKTGGEAIEAAVIFTDLANFTSMCEKVGDPERIVSTLNDYFEATTNCIFDHDGVVIKFIGDAILAVWGAPVREPEAARKAASAAWELSRQANLEIDGITLKTRIGVHFGEVVAGNIGSSRRVDYTLIGDAVNLAARLESLNKTLGTNILVSEELREQMGDGYLVRQVGRFMVKGRTLATTIYELLGPLPEEGEPEWVVRYHEALDALARDDHEAAASLLRKIHAERDDGPASYLLHRLKEDQVHPGGIIEMHTK
jgi:adenylate cyclase